MIDVSRLASWFITLWDGEIAATTLDDLTNLMTEAWERQLRPASAATLEARSLSTES